MLLTTKVLQITYKHNYLILVSSKNVCLKSILKIERYHRFERTSRKFFESFFCTHHASRESLRDQL